MTDSVSPISSSSSSEQIPQGADVQNAVAKGGSVNAATTISSVGDLKQKAPDVYNGMLQSLAMQIVNRMRRHGEHLKKIQQEYRERG